MLCRACITGVFLLPRIQFSAVIVRFSEILSSELATPQQDGLLC
jgi:hypothetical protein